METSVMDFIKMVYVMMASYAPKFLAAIIVLIVGLKMIKILSSVVGKALDKSKVEPSLSQFVKSLVSIGLKVILLIIFASMIGIETTSLVTLLGAAGLAIGLALQGSLANFAGGVLLLIFKPFKIGDFIETQGYSGSVSAIEIFNTVIKTPDNKTVIIPNGLISNGVIKNFTTENKRRIDFVFGIGYNDDIKKAKDILQKLIDKDTRILKEPAPLIGVSELADSSVNLATRVWVKTSDYWNVYFDMMEKTKLAFDENGIQIPFPQTDVHLYREAN